MCPRIAEHSTFSRVGKKKSVLPTLQGAFAVGFSKYLSIEYFLNAAFEHRSPFTAESP
jgi:hypothetical protein